MKTGFTKSQKTTLLSFNEQDEWMEVQTYNTDLKKRLTEYARKYPKECRKIHDDKQGGLTFKIHKGRLSFRLTAPYSKERRQKSSELAKENIDNLKGVEE